MDEHARQLFEAELNRRGIMFSIDGNSDRYSIPRGEGKLLISLDNIARELGGENDEARMAEFAKRVLTRNENRKRRLDPDRLYWILEPNDYVEKPHYRETISKQADRVLANFDNEAGLISWITPDMLDELGLSLEQASMAATGNLGMELATAGLEVSDMQGMPLGMFPSYLPFKASLILAPNLKRVAEEKIGWPLLAVAPVRDFVYLWPAEHLDFAGRVGKVVMREYQNSSYPISTEIFRIDDEGIKAIGAFPAEAAVAE